MPLLKSPKIYFASKIRHAPLWRDLRDGRLANCQIVSSWLDAPGLEGETSDDLASASVCARQWRSDIHEASSADFIFCYAQEEDIPHLSGTLVEIGAGLASGATVLLSGGYFPRHWTWTYHPRCIRFGGVFLDDAIGVILRSMKKGA